MKIAIVSDIHANKQAFEAVEEQMRKLQVDHVLCLGDMIGYYYDGASIVQMVNEWSCDIISGNHERMFLDYLSGNEILRKRIKLKYGGCFEMYEQTFSTSLNNRIKDLPDSKEVEFDGLKFLLCHGSPEGKDMYIYPDTSKDILDRFGNLEYDFILMGHTHYPMIYNGQNGLIINPGSVGQCRKQGGIAKWGLIDTQNGVYVQQETAYNVQPLIDQIVELEGEDSYHVNVLKRKR
jgi:putative phosphoesterase